MTDKVVQFRDLQNQTELDTLYERKARLENSIVLLNVRIKDAEAFYKNLMEHLIGLLQTSNGVKDQLIAVNDQIIAALRGGDALKP